MKIIANIYLIIRTVKVANGSGLKSLQKDYSGIASLNVDGTCLTNPMDKALRSFEQTVFYFFYK